MADKVAVVTGSNKGIGFGIVKELCRRGVAKVYLTSRDETKGREAVEKLKKEGFNPCYHQLDVTDKSSIKRLADYLNDNHGGLDILINNAGIGPAEVFETIYDDSKRVIDTNYKSFLLIQEYLLPILKDNARVINISSDCGHISNIRNATWIQRLTKNDIELEDIEAFVNWFLESVKNNTLNEDDFAEMSALSYRIAKVALCALTRLQQREIGRGISVNSLHPGFVRTDLTSNQGFLNVEEAAKAPVYLALDVSQSVKGKYFWYDKSEKDWTDSKLEIYFKLG